jgi:hypothetical protein
MRSTILLTLSAILRKYRNRIKTQIFYLFLIKQIKWHFLHKKYYFLVISNEFSTVNAIIGSTVRMARPLEFPFIVSIMNVNVNNAVPANDHICTGSLISRQHVLSAAQCTLNRQWNETVVLAGTSSLLFGSIYGISWWIRFNEWTMYRQRPTLFEDNDISITRVNNFINKISSIFVTKIYII